MRESETKKPMLARTRAAIIVVLTLVVMLAPLVAWATAKAGVELPLWLDGQTAKYLSGATTDDAIPHDGGGLFTEFMSGELQDALENKVLNNTPLRAQALLGNAKLQRTAIEASNNICKWPAYPCFYGSDTFCLDGYDAVAQVFTSELVPGWQSFARELAEFAQSNPWADVIVYVAAENLDEDANPVINLVSNAARVTDLGAILEREVGSLENVEVIIQDYKSTDEFYEDYFKTDHHWNIQGAVKAYNEIAKIEGADYLKIEGLEPIDVEFMGTRSRTGLIHLVDHPYDITNSFADISIDNGYHLKNGDDHSQFETQDMLGQMTGFYGSYFRSGDGTYRRESASEAKGILLINDSFGYAIARPMAYGFGYVKQFQWFARDVRVKDASLYATLREYDMDTAVLLATPWDFAEVSQKLPCFFSD